MGVSSQLAPSSLLGLVPFFGFPVSLSPPYPLSLSSEPSKNLLLPVRRAVPGFCGAMITRVTRKTFATRTAKVWPGSQGGRGERMSGVYSQDFSSHSKPGNAPRGMARGVQECLC